MVSSALFPVLCLSSEATYLPPARAAIEKQLVSSQIDPRLKAMELQKQKADPVKAFRWFALLPGGYVARRFLEDTKVGHGLFSLVHGC